VCFRVCVSEKENTRRESICLTFDLYVCAYVCASACVCVYISTHRHRDKAADAANFLQCDVRLCGATFIASTALFLSRSGITPCHNIIVIIILSNVSTYSATLC